MSTRLRLILSLLAVAASCFVLMADSTDDCDTYKPFNGSYSYTSNCFGDNKGTFLLATPRGKGAPPTDADFNVTSGSLTFKNGSLYYSQDNCSGGDEGTGTFTGLEFAILSPDAPSTVYRCSKWSPADKPDAIACALEQSSSDSVDASAEAPSLPLKCAIQIVPAS